MAKDRFGYGYQQGGEIKIKPSKVGTFTAAAKKRGKGVQAFASQVLANKENYSPAMVKKANFARNASKWNKKQEGGFIEDPQDPNFVLPPIDDIHPYAEIEPRWQDIAQGYYNITPPKSFSGQQLPHWLNDYVKKPMEYWNSPKLWGNPKEPEDRYWSDPKRKQEGGIIESSKDRFGFGNVVPDTWEKGGMPHWENNPDRGFFSSTRTENKVELAQELMDNFISEIKRGHNPTREEVQKYMNTAKMLEEAMQMDLVGHYKEGLMEVLGSRS